MIDRERFVPKALRELNQWLLWRFEPNPKKPEGKKLKVPLYVGGKRRTGKQGDSSDRRRLCSYQAAAKALADGQFDGLGFAFLPGDGLIGIDLDGMIDAETGEISERAGEIIKASNSYTELSPSRKGVHIIGRGKAVKSFKSNDIGVEVFCGSQYFTFTGEHYSGSPEIVNEIPEVTLRRLQKTVAKAKGHADVSRPAPAAPMNDDRAKVESALATLSPDCDYDTWLHIGMAIHAVLGDGGLAVWDYWSGKGAKYRGAKDLESHWRSFKPGGGITGATLFKFATQAGWRPARPARASRGAARVGGADPPARGAAPGEAVQTSAQPDLPPEYSEERLAAEFTRRYASDWRFVAEWSKWYFWDGKRWAPDLTLRAFDHARAVARAMAAKALRDDDLSSKEQLRASTIIASAKTIAAIERLARADRAHAATVDQWDKDPFVFNTPAGTIDLRSGGMRAHDRSDHITKQGAAAPGGERPTWTRFLNDLTGGDVDLQAFLQRVVGYCLTGSTREHALLFLYGLGSNGKSVFLNAIQGAFGDYATTASMETFVEAAFERHPTDLAMLRGARLVVAAEVEDGQRWAASRLKQLTGGDLVRARFMRQDYFEYQPQFKLLLAGNHKPAFRQVDEAMRRRFHLVPCTHTVEPAKRDLQLGEKLRAEWPGIMAWALEGCMAWQEQGLAPPAIVREATDAYLEDEDVLRAWMTEHCEREHSAFTPTAELHKSYKQWATETDERFLGMKRFSQALEDHGLTRDRANGNKIRGFRGIRVRQAQERLNAVG